MRGALAMPAADPSRTAKSASDERATPVTQRPYYIQLPIDTNSQSIIDAIEKQVIAGSRLVRRIPVTNNRWEQR
jgi:hypothetical protein